MMINYLGSQWSLIFCCGTLVGLLVNLVRARHPEFDGAAGTQDRAVPNLVDRCASRSYSTRWSVLCRLFRTEYGVQWCQWTGCLRNGIISGVRFCQSDKQPVFSVTGLAGLVSYLVANQRVTATCLHCRLNALDTLTAALADNHSRASNAI